MASIANPLEIRNIAASIWTISLSNENIFMNILRFALTVLIVCLLSTSQANAVQINLSGDNIEQYFQILEIYVLPFLVVSTIVLLCGYIASKVYNRRLNQSVEDLEEAQRSPTQRDEGTAAFLRELKSTPPIKDPVPDREPRLRLRRRRSKKKTPSVDPIPSVAAEDRPTLDRSPDRFDDSAQEPLLLRVPSVAPTAAPADRFARTSETAAAEPGTRATEDDRTVSQPEASNEPAPPVAPIPTLTVDPAPLRVDTPETPTLDSGRDVDTPVSVEPGDAPYLETPFNLKTGFDSSLTAEPSDTQAPPEEIVEPVSETPEYSPPARQALDMPLDLKLNGSAGDSANEEPDPVEDIPPPALDRTAWWADSSGTPDRVEPSTGVVQPLKPVIEAPSRDTRNAEKAATEIVRSLDRITSSLQQSMTALTDHIRHRRGLLLEDVQGLRISGFSAGVDVAERLRALDQPAVTDVHSSYAAVDGLNRIVDRLEQMAADEALDEGWNDLIRTRLSETIYAVGQGKKTLLPHLPADPPATSDNRPEKRADDAGGAPHSGGVPFGTRQG
jgi:hypothetical protein